MEIAPLDVPIIVGAPAGSGGGLEITVGDGLRGGVS